MNIRLGPLAITISWIGFKPEPAPAEPKLSLVSDLLDAAADLRMVALLLKEMDLPEESQACIHVVLHPEHLLACRPDHALAALRHVGYLAVECNLATFN